MTIRILTVTSLLLLSACTLTKNMDEMHDDTRKMSGQTEQLGTISEELRKLTGEMYKDLRQGNTDQSRRNDLISLKAARSMAEKYNIASRYMASFEYQLWSSIGQDTPAHRLELMADAAKEFMMAIQEFSYGGQSRPEPFAYRDDVDHPSSEDDAANRQQCLNALAATLHFANPKQERLAKLKGDLEVMTLAAMFEKTFDLLGKMKAGQGSGNEIPSFAHEIMKFPEVATLVMQARYNILGIAATAMISNTKDQSITLPLFGGGVVMRWRWLRVKWNVLQHYIGRSWVFDFQGLNPAQKDFLEELYRMGESARETLRRNGIKPKLVPLVKLVMSDLRLTARQKILLNEPQVSLAQEDQRQVLLIKTIQNY